MGRDTVGLGYASDEESATFIAGTIAHRVCTLTLTDVVSLLARL